MILQGTAKVGDLQKLPNFLKNVLQRTSKQGRSEGRRERGRERVRTRAEATLSLEIPRCKDTYLPQKLQHASSFTQTKGTNYLPTTKKERKKE